MNPTPESVRESIDLLTTTYHPHQIELHHLEPVMQAQVNYVAEALDKYKADILFLRNDYSRFGARPCPACEYQNGKFIKLCKLHEEIEALKQDLMAISKFYHESETEITSLTSRLNEAKKALKLCIANCGNPDARDGLRAVIQTAKEALQKIQGIKS